MKRASGLMKEEQMLFSIFRIYFQGPTAYTGTCATKKREGWEESKENMCTSPITDDILEQLPLRDLTPILKR
jgi:hypothetical protein